MTNEERQQICKRLIELAGLLDYPTAEVANNSDLVLEDLESHYVRLFINNLGGVSAPPFAGCYIEQVDRLDFMSKFSGLCRGRGINIDSSYPPDYIPLMVESLALMLSAGTDGSEIKPVINEFYAHWPRPFAAALLKHDQTGLYAPVGDEICRIIDNIPKSFSDN